NSTGYLLQSKTGAITGGVWQSVTNVPVVRGVLKFVTNSIGTVPKFYRLSNTNTPPSLTAVRSGPNIKISWSTNPPGFSLRATAFLNATSSWVAVSNIPAVQGDQYYILDGITNPAR